MCLIKGGVRYLVPPFVVAENMIKSIRIQDRTEDLVMALTKNAQKI